MTESECKASVGYVDPESADCRVATVDVNVRLEERIAFPVARGSAARAGLSFTDAHGCAAIPLISGHSPPWQMLDGVKSRCGEGVPSVISAI